MILSTVGKLRLLTVLRLLMRHHCSPPGPQLFTLLQMRMYQLLMETKLELLFLSRPEICLLQHGKSRCHQTSFYCFSLAFSYLVNCLCESVKKRGRIKGGRRGCQQLQLCSWMWHGPREPRTLFFSYVLINPAR